MLSSGLIEFLLYLLIPVVLVNFLQGRQSNDSSLARKNRLSLVDRLVYGCILVLAIAYFLSATSQPPPNVFKRIGASPYAPCKGLREKLAEHVRQHPELAPPGGVPEGTAKNTHGFELLEYYQGSEYGHLDFLVDRFCTFPEDRDVYLRFGEEAFMSSISSSFGPRGMAPRVAMPNAGEAKSRILTEYPDIGYLLYSVASQFFTYLPAFVLVGLVTTPFGASAYAPSRVYVRPWGVVTLCVLFSADIYWLFSAPMQLKQRKTGLSTMWIISPDSSDPAAFYADAAQFTRKVFLAVSLVAFLLMDCMTSSRQTDIQLLRQCIEEQKSSLMYSKDHTLLETSVLLSDRLRQRLAAVWRREKQARDQVFSDPEFMELYEKTQAQTKSGLRASQAIPEALAKLGLASEVVEKEEAVAEEM